MNIKNKNLIAVLIILFVAVIYNFPALLGMVDTPFDIRDIRMYPWRYHNLDTKINKMTLWEGQFPQEQKIYSADINKDVFRFPISAGTSSQLAFDFNVKNVDQIKSKKLSDLNFYLQLHYKEAMNKDKTFKFGLSLLDSTTGTTYTPGFTVLPVFMKPESKGWYKATFNLNKFFNQAVSIYDLKDYKLIISAENNNKSHDSYLSLSDIRLSVEDFTNVRKVHNHFNNDLIQTFTPAREYYSNAIKHFRLPFWNNFILTGSEFLAEPQIGFFHPLYLATYFLFDHFTAHQLITFLALFLCGIGAFVLSSYWGMSVFVSLFVAIVYMFQPVNATWYSYEHTLMTTATLPFLIYAYDKHLKTKKLLSKYFLIASLLLGLIFLSGHLQRVYYSVIFFALFAIFKFFVELYKTKKLDVVSLFSFIFALLIGLLIGAIVIVPFIPLYLESHRVTIPDSLIGKTSIPFKAFVGLLYPFYGGIPEWPLSGFFEKTSEYATYRLGFMRNYMYFGLLPFICSLFSLQFIKKNKIVSFFILTIIFSLLICTGTPVFYFLREILPGFKTMQHYKFLFLYSVSVPFLAGFGFDYLLGRLQKNRWKSIIVATVIVFTILDLMYFSLYFVTWSKRTDYKPLPQQGILQTLNLPQAKSNEPFRVLPFISHVVQGTALKSDIAEPNTLFPYGIEEVSGYSSFISKDLYYLFYYIQLHNKDKLYKGDIFNLFSNFNTPYPISNYHSKILDLLNVKYFIVPNFITVSSSKLKKIYQNDSVIYLNNNSLPRAFIVPNYKIIEDPKETIVYLDSEEFEPREVVVLMNEPVIAREQSGLLRTSGARNDIDFLNYEPENIKLKVQTDNAGFLILGHNLNNNWKVKVNGKEDKHIKANLVQRAVYLPKPGSYEIEFYYYPKLFFIGGGITLGALLILLMLAFYLSRQQTVDSRQR